jgi:hypothetical protein
MKKKTKIRNIATMRVVHRSGEMEIVNGLEDCFRGLKVDRLVYDDSRLLNLYFLDLYFLALTEDLLVQARLDSLCARSGNVDHRG